MQTTTVSDGLTADTPCTYVRINATHRPIRMRPEDMTSTLIPILTRDVTTPNPIRAPI